MENEHLIKIKLIFFLFQVHLLKLHGIKMHDLIKRYENLKLNNEQILALLVIFLKKIKKVQK